MQRKGPGTSAMLTHTRQHEQKTTVQCMLTQRARHQQPRKGQTDTQTDTGRHADRHAHTPRLLLAVWTSSKKLDCEISEHSLRRAG